MDDRKCQKIQNKKKIQSVRQPGQKCMKFNLIGDKQLDAHKSTGANRFLHNVN